MVSLDAFPSRSLDMSEANAFEERDGVDSAIPYVFDGCSCQTADVTHLFLEVDGEYVGYDFDPEAQRWRILARAPTWDAARTAYAQHWEAEREAEAGASGR
ncbi:hypothetical protein OB905_01010 [Halobacteria archaeon AArc-dxtr1]|nr:hypothetical protein [Halobacteria archaeon AArc-dxtr1]